MKQETLAQAAGDLHMYPQILINVRVAKKDDYASHPKVKQAVATAEILLDGKGRILLRPSGTEPLLRVMAEGEDGAKVKLCAEKIAEAVRSAAS
jgi:phosphoglucosamine mutase